MENQLKTLVIILLTLLTSCGSSKHGKDADNKTTKQVSAVIDSIVASEPEMSISSLSVIEAPMPSMFAEEVRPALEQTGNMAATFLIAQAFGGKSSSDDSSIWEGFVAMGAPLREAMKKYESEDHPDYVFGLVKVANTKDSTMNERRVYIFDQDNLNSVKRVERFPKKKNKDLGLLFALAYGDQMDLSKKDIEPKDFKMITDQPVLNFIVNE